MGCVRSLGAMRAAREVKGDRMGGGVICEEMGGYDLGLTG